MTEFMYYELLVRGMEPAAALDQLKKVIPIAGDKHVEGALVPSLGLKLMKVEELAKAEKKAER